ncbi:uncharacterized protein KY384_001544 [Bacidia gigantensis]|uniref:uncharacterized protein n=1 Tax=Bacidia gigantensis TaxID=2732470 RepID=UPI001D0575F5|nr:uncharacterized protein KY384_001544 [Bacidia gigantensis]KAG8533803.1 hypothetical protein KY384_001544 [Bacidia gigantensis]
MAYFIPSFLQKRLLRYVLARLELLDIDALALENLNISWGKRSTIELKDVGVNTQKLITLLNLPRTWSISEARLILLRLTIPADLHQSSILVEIDGVKVQLDAHQLDSDPGQIPLDKTERRGFPNPSGEYKSDRPRSSQSDVHDPGGTKSDYAQESFDAGTRDISQPIPSTVELAQSFLETEPEHEKEELEEVLLQSQNLKQSQISDIESEGDNNTGFGSDLSLPAFLANFLKDVADRVQVDIKNIHVDLHLPISLDALGAEPARQPEKITSRLMIGSINIESKHKSVAVENENLRGDATTTSMGNFRSIDIRRIKLMIVSDSTIMFQTAGTPSPPSPETVQLPQQPLNETPEDRGNNQLHKKSEIKATFTPRSPGDLTGNLLDPTSATILRAKLPKVEESTLSSRESNESIRAVQDSGGPFPPFQRRPSSSHGDDLAQSRLYSHEDAVSMYMSAMDGVYPKHKKGSPAPPGGWHSTFSDDSDDCRQDIEQSTSLYESMSPHSTTISGEERPSLQSNQEIDPILREAGGASIPTPRSSQSHSLTGSPGTAPESEDAQKSTSRCSSLSSSSSIPSGKAKRSLVLIKQFCTIASIKITVPIFSTPPIQAPNPVSPFDEPAGESMPSRAIQIGIVGLELVSDMTLTKTLLLALQQSYWKPSGTGSDYRDSQPALADNSKKAFSATFSGFSWRFVDSVQSYHPVSASIIPETRGALSGESEVLLRADVSSLRFDHEYSTLPAATKVIIKDLSFGYSSGSILSFDSSMSMRESTRNVHNASGGDIVMNITNTGDGVAVEISTVPIHIYLDTRRLDETFGWFGGLSSMLELGNSMFSTLTPKEARAPPTPSIKPKRSVHFEAHAHRMPLANARSPSQNKIDMRISGVFLEMQGQQALVEVRSTAIKIVNRAEVFGLQIDGINLAGPRSLEHEVRVATAMQVSNLRLEYLATPKEVDLARLIELVFPSNLQDEDQFKDGLLVDTLLRQRRQGGALRATVEHLDGDFANIEQLHSFLSITEDLKKFSTITKYLPQDDRPGILILTLVKSINLRIWLDDDFGLAQLTSKHAEIAHVTLPSLAAIGLKSIEVNRNGSEQLIGTSLPFDMDLDPGLPVILARYICNEMVPVVRVRVHDLRVEYHVSTVTALIDFQAKILKEELVSSLMASVITVTGRQPGEIGLSSGNQPRPISRGEPETYTSLPEIDMVLKDLIIGLNPRKSMSKAYLLLEEAQLSTTSSQIQVHSVLKVSKANLMLTDHITPNSSAFGMGKTRDILAQAGFVLVGTLSATTFDLRVKETTAQSARLIEADIEGGFLLLESCADSTQTLQDLFNGLSVPKPKEPELKYRTEAVAVEDMLASFTGDAYVTSGQNQSDDAIISSSLDEEVVMNDDDPQSLEYVSTFYSPDLNTDSGILTNSILEEDLKDLSSQSSVDGFEKGQQSESSEGLPHVTAGNDPLDFRDDYFAASPATADRLIPSTRRYSYGHNDGLQSSTNPLVARVRDFHVIWNLFDGYDWQHTRDEISKAIAEVQARVNERTSRMEKRRSLDLQPNGENVIGDILFNSIYIGVPAKTDPADLTRQISRNLDDLASETGSYDTSTASRSPSRRKPESTGMIKGLRLGRSKYHKMTFELQGVSADVVVHSPNTGDLQSSVVIGVQNLDIFDHLPTSTWKKFATYMRDAGEREVGTRMIHIEISNVKPMPDLAASEIVLKASVLPIRLHVDQDALDFLSRFFEFRAETALSTIDTTELPFFQRVEVNTIRVKLDFKPKRVDYAGLRSGHTTEFMNFFVLDRAEMFLRHVIIYGVSGFDRLGKTLNDIWMPDIKRNQLPGVLAGLGPIRSLVNMGNGVRDLVLVPITEYRKDGRVVRSFQKGALSFAKTTTSELTKLGAKLAIGTQTVLQEAEDLLSEQTRHNKAERLGDWIDAEVDAEEEEEISLYANQPVGVIQGLRGGYASLERDLLAAKDVIIAMPGEIMESGTAGGAARAIMKIAPTVILRPAMGVSKAVGQTLMGATNSLDSTNRRQVEDKYKIR